MSAGPLSRTTLLCYSAGSIVETSVYGFCGLYLLNFYTDVVRLDPRLAGYALAICFVIDAVVDPPIGHISDRATFKSGRRRPFFLPAAIASGVMFYLLLTPGDGTPAQHFLYLAIISSTLFVCLSVFGIPYIALSWEMTLDYHERTRIAAYRRFAEVAGEILATLTMPLLLLFAVQSGHQSEINEAPYYSTAAAIIGAACVAAALLSLLGTSEPNRRAAVNQSDFLDGVWAAFRNKPFVILLSTFTLVAVADRAATALLVYLLEHLHGVAKQNATSLFLAFFAGSLLSPPVWLLVAKRVGKKIAYIISIVSWGVAFGSFAACPWSAGALHVVAALMGAASSGVFSIPEAIFPDIIEWDEVRTAQRREGAYAGVARFSWQLAAAGCFAVVGQLLSAVGYSGDEETSVDVLWGLRLIFVGLPAVLLAAAIIVFRYFPMTAESHAAMVEELQSRRDRRET